MPGWGRCRQCGQTIWWGANPSHPDRAFPFDDQDAQRSHFDTCSGFERAWDPAGTTHAVWTCRACGERVWWTVTAQGRRPFNVDGDRATDRLHFDTCQGQPASARVTVDEPPPRTEEPSRNGWERSDGARGPSNVPYAIALWLPDLDLAWPCSHQDVVSAFRRLALRTHPDMGGNASDFIRVRNAYDRLCQLIPDQIAV